MSKYWFKTFTKHTKPYNAWICKIDKQIEDRTSSAEDDASSKEEADRTPWGGSSLAPAADFWKEMNPVRGEGKE